MVIEACSEHAVVVDLPPLPEATGELSAVTEIVYETGGCDLVIDFSRVEIITSACISSLLVLHTMLIQSGRRLVLCSVCAPVRRIFELTGLDEVFRFAQDDSAALKELRPPRGEG